MERQAEAGRNGIVIAHAEHAFQSWLRSFHSMTLKRW